MIRLFTHTDLDGIGSSIISKALKNYVPSFSLVDITYCEPNTINDEVRKFISEKQYMHYTDIFITDLSVCKDVASKIDEINKESKEHRFTLLDHHKTAEYLNEYEWATVSCEEQISGESYNSIFKHSGTSLFYTYISTTYGNFIPGILNTKLKEFTELVRLYDTWEWSTLKNSTIRNYSYNMNTLLKIYDRDKFIDTMVTRIITAPVAVRWSWWFDDVDTELLELEYSRNEKYIKDVVDGKIHLCNDNDGNTFGLVFAEKCINDISTYVSDNYMGIDYVAIVSMSNRTVSLRTRYDNVDVSVIAKRNGGGGHKQSSGFVINDEMMNLFIRSITNLIK